VTRRNLDGLSARLVDVWNAQLHGIFLKLALFRVTQPCCTNVPGISPDLTLSPDLQICISRSTDLYRYTVSHLHSPWEPHTCIPRNTRSQHPHYKNKHLRDCGAGSTCSSRESSAIVNGDDAGEQDGRISEPCGDRTRDKSRRLSGAMSTSRRLRCWTPPDDLVRASAIDLELGRSICEHNRKRNRCKDCGGASICEHNRKRSLCKDCGCNDTDL
jgi:hypothetical protein